MNQPDYGGDLPEINNHPTGAMFSRFYASSYSYPYS